MTRPALHTPWTAAALALLTLAPVASATAQDSFEKALAAYRDYLGRPSLAKRMLGRFKLAATDDERAMHTLVDSYKGVEAPKDQIRYMLASLITREFKDDLTWEMRASWRKSNKSPMDTWLWYETSRHALLTDESQTAALAEAAGRGDSFQRMARFMGAMSAHNDVRDDPTFATTCHDLMAKLPRKDIDKALTVETVGTCLLYAKNGIREEPWKSVAALVIDQLENKKLPHRTKVTLSRTLAKAFDTTNLGFDPKWWRTELDRDPAAVRAAGTTGNTVSFMSVDTFGTRFVYLIDASDSMLKTISELQDMGPITGPKTGSADGPPEQKLDWGRIKTRFDAAREYLRISLLNLEPHHQFAVVLFGDTAETLTATPRLVEASPRNIDAAIQEIAGIKAGPSTARRPDGVLRGQTNLHAGILTAYQITDRGVGTKKPEYVDPAAMLDGCDTLFVLSDGAPTVCNWAQLDSRDPEDQAGDPETGVRYDNVPQLLFQSPYGRPPYDTIVEDVERLNLFRKAEVHCVGMGEADAGLLKSIARVTGGTAVTVKER